jgi:hypothetical protein
MWTMIVVSATAIAYDTIFSNLIKKSFKFWPLKLHGTYEPWPKNLCSKCKFELNPILNHRKPHDYRDNNFMGKWGLGFRAIKSSFQLHFSKKFNVEYTYKRLVMNFSCHGLSLIPSSPPL